MFNLQELVTDELQYNLCLFLINNQKNTIAPNKGCNPLITVIHVPMPVLLPL